VITVWDNARDNCPVFPGGTVRLHWSFEDPAAVEESEAGRLASFRRVRDQLRQRVETFVTADLRPPSSPSMEATTI